MVKMVERIIGDSWSRGTSSKKYRVQVKNIQSGKIRTIQFGAKGYEQYKDLTKLKYYSSSNHGDRQLRRNYFSRHSGISTKKLALDKEIRKSGGTYNAKILSHKYLW